MNIWDHIADWAWTVVLAVAGWAFHLDHRMSALEMRQLKTETEAANTVKLLEEVRGDIKEVLRHLAK